MTHFTPSARKSLPGEATDMTTPMPKTYPQARPSVVAQTAKSADATQSRPLRFGYSEFGILRALGIHSRLLRSRALAPLPALSAIAALFFAIANPHTARAGISLRERCEPLIEERKASELQAIAEIALKKTPTDAEAKYYLGVSLMLQEKHTEAIDYLDRAIAIAPGVSEYHRALGDAHGLAALRASLTHALSHAKKGRAALVKAIELDPKNTQARISLAMFYVHAPGIAGGSNKKGQEQIAEIEKLDPEAAWRMRVLACMADKHHDDARVLLDAKLATEPGCYFALTQIGRISYETKRNPGEGITALKRAVQIPQDRVSPGHARVNYWLGALHERIKDKLSARAFYEAAAALSPDVKEFKTALAKLK